MGTKLQLTELSPDDESLSLPYSRFWFSIDDSWGWAGGTYGNSLLHTGCRLPTGSWDCTATCLDVNQGPALLWGQKKHHDGHYHQLP